MFQFLKKKPTENVPETFQKRITKLESDVLDLYMSQNALRDKVLRKIQSKREQEEEEKEKKAKDLYTGVFLNNDGTPI